MCLYQMICMSVCVFHLDITKFALQTKAHLKWFVFHRQRYACNTSSCHMHHSSSSRHCQFTQQTRSLIYCINYHGRLLTAHQYYSIHLLNYHCSLPTPLQYYSLHILNYDCSLLIAPSIIHYIYSFMTAVY